MAQTKGAAEAKPRRRTAWSAWHGVRKSSWPNWSSVLKFREFRIYLYIIPLGCPGDPQPLDFIKIPGECNFQMFMKSCSESLRQEAQFFIFSLWLRSIMYGYLTTNSLGMPTRSPCIFLSLRTVKSFLFSRTLKLLCYDVPYSLTLKSQGFIKKTKNMQNHTHI